MLNCCILWAASSVASFGKVLPDMTNMFLKVRSCHRGRDSLRNFARSVRTASSLPIDISDTSVSSGGSVYLIPKEDFNLSSTVMWRRKLRFVANGGIRGNQMRLLRRWRLGGTSPVAHRVSSIRFSYPYLMPKSTIITNRTNWRARSGCISE